MKSRKFMGSTAEGTRQYEFRYSASSVKLVYSCNSTIFHFIMRVY